MTEEVTYQEPANVINKEIPLDTVITLVTKDQDQIKTKYGVVWICALINNMMENFDDYDNVVISLNTISTVILEKILVYCNHYENKEENEVPQFSFEFDEFETKYLEMDEEFIKEVVEAAHFLAASQLVNLLCKKIADIIRAKTPEEIEEIFAPIKKPEIEEE